MLTLTEGSPPGFSRRELLRLGAAGLGAGAVAAALAGCSGQPQHTVTSGPVDLAFWTHDEAYATFFTEALPLVAEHSDFDPTLTLTRAGAGDLVTKMLAQAIAGTGTPDVIGLEIGQFSRVLRGDIAAELLVGLDDAVADYRDDLMPARTAPFSKGGELYALDSDCPMTVYYYREDIFDSLGVPLPSEAGTWEEFLAAVTPISSANDVSFAAFATGSDIGQIVQSFWFMLLQRGGQIFTADGDLSIDTPEAEDALALMVQGVQSGAFASVTDYYGGTIQNALASGKIAGISMPSWYAIYGIKPNVPDQSGLWRVAELPRFAGGGGRTAVGGGTGFAALKDKPNSDAALALILNAYLDPEQQVKRFHDLGYMPTLRSVYDREDMFGLHDEYFGGQDVFEVFHEIVDDAPDCYISENLPIVNTVLSGRILQAYRGTLTPAQALSAATEDYRGQARGSRS